MNKGFPDPRIVDAMVEAPSWHYVDVPVIDGVARLPDGTTVRSSGDVVRVPVADVLPLVPEEPDEDSLDAAWAEAEAALPEGCTLKLEHDPSITDLPTSADAIEYAEWSVAHVDAESPAAALRALAAKLRERDPDGREDPEFGHLVDSDVRPGFGGPSAG